MTCYTTITRTKVSNSIALNSDSPGSSSSLPEINNPAYAGVRGWGHNGCHQPDHHIGPKWIQVPQTL